MTGRLVVVSGTGTGIGKTHFAEALLLALGQRGIRATGVKPVETGFEDPDASDASRLARASPFHVKHAGVRFGDPVSPHVAAREAGTAISLAALADEIAAVRAVADPTLAELAGGLFSPLTDTETNAHLTAVLRPDVHILVAPDRLGVLHDLIATTRAAASVPVRVDGIVLTAPEAPDTSTGRNAAEIPRLLRVPLLASVPRGTAASLAHTAAIDAVCARVLAALDPG